MGHTRAGGFHRLAFQPTFDGASSTASRDASMSVASWNERRSKHSTGFPAQARQGADPRTCATCTSGWCRSAIDAICDRVLNDNAYSRTPSRCPRPPPHDALRLATTGHRFALRGWVTIGRAFARRSSFHVAERWEPLKFERRKGKRSDRPVRRPTWLLAPDITPWHKRAIETFELGRWMPELLSARPVRRKRPATHAVS